MDKPKVSKLYWTTEDHFGASKRFRWTLTFSGRSHTRTEFTLGSWTLPGPSLAGSGTSHGGTGRWERALQREALLDPCWRSRETTVKDNERQMVCTTFTLVPALKGVSLVTNSFFTKRKALACYLRNFKKHCKIFCLHVFLDFFIVRFCSLVTEWQALGNDLHSEQGEQSQAFFFKTRSELKETCVPQCSSQHCL